MPDNDTSLPNRFGFNNDPAYVERVRRDSAEAARVLDRVRAVLPGEPDDQRLDRELLERRSSDESKPTKL